MVPLTLVVPAIAVVSVDAADISIVNLAFECGSPTGAHHRIQVVTVIDETSHPHVNTRMWILAECMQQRTHSLHARHHIRSVRSNYMHTSQSAKSNRPNPQPRGYGLRTVAPTQAIHIGNMSHGNTMDGDNRRHGRHMMHNNRMNHIMVMGWKHRRTNQRFRTPTVNQSYIQRTKGIITSWNRRNGRWCNLPTETDAWGWPAQPTPRQHGTGV